VAARAARGTRVIVIDPRHTATCESADLHLPLAIGSDVALFAGLLVYLADQGCVDRVWTTAHTEGLDAALAAARAAAGTVAKVAAVTKLPAETILAFYGAFAGTERVLTIFSQGVNQSSTGTDKVNAIINCHLATGRIGRPGMGPFSVTGQPNAMGGREVGGLATQLAAHMRFDSNADIDRVRRFWDAPAIARRPGLKAVDLFDAVAAGRVKAIWIAATNPAASMPRAAEVRRALAACPLVVVSDCWPTDTTALADIVLPAASWGEKDGTVTNSERCISRQRAFRAPPGAARPDWWMFAEVARRLGWGASFAYRSPADIFREHAALSSFENEGSRAFDIGGLAALSDAEYGALQPLRWPVIDGSGTARLFAEGGFFTPDRRARLVATHFRPVAAAASRAQPFLLNTGRVRDQWHTMTRTGFVPRLMSHQDEPFLEISPDDAAKLSIADGDLVQIETCHASTVLRARPTPAQRRGEIFVPMHWTDAFVSSGPIGRLVGAACDPLSGQPELKATPAKLAPLPTLWRGFLLCAAAPSRFQGFYGARIPVAGGQAYELRGWDPLPPAAEARDLARSLVRHSPSAEWREWIDESRGSFRFVSTVRGRLEACLLVSSRPSWMLPDREAVIALLGAPFDARAEEIVTAMPPAAAGPAGAGGRKVCACFSVSRAAIEQAVVGGGLTSAAAIGAVLKAGTNCGSCIPELDEILRDARARPPAVALRVPSRIEA
jgi:assimilatory nitrate reductase catalytic subunit